MAQEEIKYTIANNQQPSTPNDGAVVDVTFTYNPSAPNSDGSYTVTGASGTYSALNAAGQVVSTDTITGVTAPGTTITTGGGSSTPDGKLFIVGNPTTTPIVTAEGVAYTINNAADSNDGKGNVVFSDANSNSFPPMPPSDTPYYASGNNGNQATGVTETAAVCFVSGTLIRTARGEISVQDLTTEDRVVTASGTERRVKWLGQRTIEIANYATPELVWPVRVAKDAFGTNLPERDLYLSPGHAVCVNCVDEVLIPVGELVNGATIVRVKIDDVTYWHVELDAHDILFANSLPAESYLDVGNRSFFSGETSAPDADRALQTVERYCRPFSIDRVIVEAIRSRLRTQALHLGWRIADIDANVRLEVDGSVVLPRLADGVARFVVPADARDVWLVSKTFVPRGLDISADPRTLGVRLIGIGIDDGLGHRAEVSMDDSRFCLGFHAPEWEGETALRWTAGRCKLPASVWSGCEGEFFLKLQLASTAITSWTAPDETQGDDELSTGSRLRPHLIEALAA